MFRGASVMDAAFPTIPGFEIQKLLGQGGMGRVFLARQQSLDRPVAIKVLTARLAANPSHLQRFKQEARAAARIKHPGLVQVLDAGEHAGLFYYVMEYVSGETTAQRLRRKGRLDEKSALLIAESVAVALEFAWREARLVHRDIKPDNILIDGDGTVKVADLGLAKLLDQQGEAITLSRALIGTPHYCAPEQARGGERVDCRADIYGLGATLYHFIVGRAPFADSSGVAAMVRALTDFVPDPMDCHPDVSSRMAWLIEKMMARDPEHRQAGWSEALDDIEQVFEGRPPSSSRLPARRSTLLRSARRSLAEDPPPGPEPEGLPSGPAPEDGAELETGAAAEAGVPAPGEITSGAFRFFLLLAAVFTVLLYLAWFWMEREDRAGGGAAPIRAVAPADSR